MSDKEVELMWDQYSLTKSPEIKKKIIIHYASLVKYIAGRLNMYLGQNIEYDDLISYGVFGLIDAIDKFDLTKNVKFETYASLRIRGAIIDNIRKMDWVPRSLRKDKKDLEKASSELENTLGRPATDEEMMEFLDITSEQFEELLKKTSITTLISLEQYVEQGQTIGNANSSSNSAQNPEQYVEKLEIKNMLKDAIDELPERERKVITLYYFEELMLKEISNIMGVSESRISQLHTKGISRLKGKLGEKGEVRLIRPIDTQVLYPQTPEIAGRQHKSNQLPLEQQSQFGNIMKKEVETKKDTIIQSQESEHLKTNQDGSKQLADKNSKGQKKKRNNKQTKKKKRKPSESRIDIRI